MSDFEPEEQWFLKIFESLREDFEHFDLWTDGIGHKIEEWHARSRYRHPSIDKMLKRLVLDMMSTLQNSDTSEDTQDEME